MAQYQGRKITLNKPFRTPGKSKKFAVYVKNQRTGDVNIVRFGDPDMRIRSNIPARRRSFMARMGAILQKVRGQKSLSPAYWSIRAWR
jgi:hypothetical protein